MYSYSLWLVFTPPPELVEVMETHNMISHIPHVTIETNIESFDEAMARRRRRPLKDVITIDAFPQVFDNHYDNDPLHSWGYPVSVIHNEVSHEPHLTVQYSTIPFKDCDGPYLTFIVDAHLEVATCHSKAPYDWHVLTQQMF